MHLQDTIYDEYLEKLYELDNKTKRLYLKNREYAGYISNFLKEFSANKTATMHDIKYAIVGIVHSSNRTINSALVNREYPIIEKVVRTMEKKGLVKINGNMVTITEEGIESLETFRAVNMLHIQTYASHFRDQLKIILYMKDRLFRIYKGEGSRYLAGKLQGDLEENIKLMDDAIDFLVEYGFLIKAEPMLDESAEDVEGKYVINHRRMFMWDIFDILNQENDDIRDEYVFPQGK